MPKLLIPISNGFEEIETITIVDVCRRANIDVTTASIEDIEVTGAHRVTIIADELLNEINDDDFDMIVLPGGLPNAFNLAESELLKNILKNFENKNKKIGAICAAPFALHKANVLSENYTCYPSFENKIKTEGYDALKNVVIDGNILTSRGPGTAMEFALEIVKVLVNEDKYNEVKEGLLF